MKVEIRREREGSLVVTRPCPYPKRSTVEGDPKVGSLSCSRCKQYAGRTDTHVFCRAGDKKPWEPKEDSHA